MTDAMQRYCQACRLKDEMTKERQKSNTTCPKHVLDVRIIPGDPSGAWIESYQNSCDPNALPGTAEQLALFEQQRVMSINKQKSDRLKEFQREVSERVKRILYMKRKEEQLKSLQAVKNENNLVYQRAVGTKSSFRMAQDELQSSERNNPRSSNGPRKIDDQTREISVEGGKLGRFIDIRAQQVGQEMRSARLQLLSRSVQTNCKSYSEESIDVSAPRAVECEPELDTWTGVNAINRREFRVSSDLEKENSPPVTDLGLADESDSKIISLPHDETRFEPDEQHTTGSLLEHLFTDQPVNSRSCPSPSRHDACRMANLRKSLGDVLQPRQTLEHDKAHQKTQVWRCRKLFMDMEREHVRESKKRQEHRKNIGRLKMAKEQQRQVIEDEITVFPEEVAAGSIDERPSRSTSGNVPGNSPARSQRTKLRRKDKDLYRYVTALREVARERILLAGIAPPPLCTCGFTILDTHPDTCANNCIFYKNPGGYIEALSAAMVSTG